jgi:predicted alpha/beta hydrolase family esterase
MFQGTHTMTTTLIVPGLKSSGPTHWQSWFEQRIPGSLRVIQRDWNDTHLPDWSSRVRRDIARTPGQLFIVAHSFGVLAAVQAASDHAHRISGALLVAPADPDTFGVSEFLPQTRLGFPAVVVGSTNDPWMTLASAAHWADLWGADFVNLGEAGHINTESGFGPWPEGLSLLERLRHASEFRRLQEPRAALQLASGRRATRSRVYGRRLRSSVSLTDDGRYLKQAAALLEEAGWQVVPPNRAAHVTGA